ncbi:MAG: phosphoribosyltransferase family protein [Pseudomonadota bacterium]
MQKTYISAEQLLQDSFALALEVAASGFKPELIVGVWRGGAPIAIVMQEVLEFTGLACNHLSIKTSSYSGIGKRTEVKVQGMETLAIQLNGIHSILLVDDIFDSGLSMAKVLDEIRAICSSKLEIKIATPYYKPANNQTNLQPDFFLQNTADWLVFPHELQGLTQDELLDKPIPQALKQRLLELKGVYRSQTSDRKKANL